MPLESREGSTNGPAKPFEDNGPAKPLEENFAHTEAAIHRTSEAEGDSVDRGATSAEAPSNNGPAKPLEENFAHTEAAIHRTSEAEGDSVDRGATSTEARAGIALRSDYMPLESCDASNNGPAKPLEENFAHTEPAIHRTSEAEGDSGDRGATSVNNDGTADQGEFERLVAEAAAQLPKPAQLASVPGLATVDDGIGPPHSLEPDYPARRDALRGPRTMIKMSFLVVGILSMPIAYYFWMGAGDIVQGASPPEQASFDSKPIIPPPKSSTEEETGERAAQRDAQTPIPAPAVASPAATTDRTAVDAQTLIPVASPTATTDRTAVEAQTPIPAPRPAATTDRTAGEAQTPIPAPGPAATTGRAAVEAQTPIPAPRPTATTDRTTVEAQTPVPAPAATSPTAATGRTAVAPAEQNVTPSDQRDTDETVVLLKRGQDLLRHGDLPAARLVLRHAADAKNAEAALTLGSTYDPVTLRELRVYGFSADVGMARSWYEKAKELGSAEAAQRLDKLGH